MMIFSVYITIVAGKIHACIYTPFLYAFNKILLRQHIVLKLALKIVIYFNNYKSTTIVCK